MNIESTLLASKNKLNGKQIYVVACGCEYLNII